MRESTEDRSKEAPGCRVCELFAHGEIWWEGVTPDGTVLGLCESEEAAIADTWIWYDAQQARERAAVHALWVEGPDSESARAARGEGSRKWKVEPTEVMRANGRGWRRRWAVRCSACGHGNWAFATEAEALRKRDEKERTP